MCICYRCSLEEGIITVTQHERSKPGVEFEQLLKLWKEDLSGIGLFSLVYAEELPSHIMDSCHEGACTLCSFPLMVIDIYVFQVRDDLKG